MDKTLDKALKKQSSKKRRTSTIGAPIHIAKLDAAIHESVRLSRLGVTPDGDPSAGEQNTSSYITPDGGAASAAPAEERMVKNV